MKTLILPAFFALVTSAFAKVEVFEISKNNVDLLPKGRKPMESSRLRDQKHLDRMPDRRIGGQPQSANMGAFWGADGESLRGCLYDLCLRGKNDQLTIFPRPANRVKFPMSDPSPDGNGVEVVVIFRSFGLLCSNGIFTKSRRTKAGMAIDTFFAASSSLSRVRSATDGPASIPRGRFGSIEWADSVDPSHKAGYAYAWLPNEDGQVAPRNSTLNPGDEIKKFDDLSPWENLRLMLFGVVATKLGKTGRLKLNPHGY